MRVVDFPLDVIPAAGNFTVVQEMPVRIQQLYCTIRRQRTAAGVPHHFVKQKPALA